MDNTRTPFRYSYFQPTFGKEEAYLKPQLTYERLRACRGLGRRRARDPAS